jgi:hypothetical protein
MCCFQGPYVARKSIGIGVAVLVNALLILYFAARPGITALSRATGVSAAVTTPPAHKASGSAPVDASDPSQPLLGLRVPSGGKRGIAINTGTEELTCLAGHGASAGAFEPRVLTLRLSGRCVLV